MFFIYVDLIMWDIENYNRGNFIKILLFEIVKLGDYYRWVVFVLVLWYLRDRFYVRVGVKGVFLFLLFL